MATLAAPTHESVSRLYHLQSQTAAAYVSQESVPFDSSEQLQQPLRRWLRLVDTYNKDWRGVRQQNLTDDIRHRGVFSVRHDRTPLFTMQVNLATATLPKWRPQVTLSRRVLEDDDA